MISFLVLKYRIALTDSLSKCGIITETCEEIKIIMYAVLPVRLADCIGCLGEKTRSHRDS